MCWIAQPWWYVSSSCMPNTSVVLSLQRKTRKASAKKNLLKNMRNRQDNIAKNIKARIVLKVEFKALVTRGNLQATGSSNFPEDNTRIISNSHDLLKIFFLWSKQSLCNIWPFLGHVMFHVASRLPVKVAPCDMGLSCWGKTLTPWSFSWTLQMACTIPD